MLDHLFPDNIAGPVLALIICLYAITSGVAFFLKKNTSLNSRIKINAEGYPFPKCFTSRHLFCGINIMFGGGTMITMVTILENITNLIMYFRDSSDLINTGL